MKRVLGIQVAAWLPAFAGVLQAPWLVDEETSKENRTRCVYWRFAALDPEQREAIRVHDHSRGVARGIPGGRR